MEDSAAAYIAQLKGFKKDLEVVPIAIGNIFTFIDNYIQLHEEYRIMKEEIKSLKEELETRNREELNYNNVSLVRQQAKQMDDMANKITILERQLLIARSSASNTNVSTAAIPITKSDIVSDSSTTLPIMEEKEVVLDTKKKGGRKSAAAKKEEAAALAVSSTPAASATPIEPADEPPAKPAKKPRKKKTDDPTPSVVIPIQTDLKPENIVDQEENKPTQTPNETVTPVEVIQQAVENNSKPLETSSLVEEVSNSSSELASSPMEAPPIPIANPLTPPASPPPASPPPASEEAPAPASVVTVSYEEPINVNEQVPETPDIDDMELKTISGTKYWEYKGLLYQFINYETAGCFVRKL